MIKKKIKYIIRIINIFKRIVYTAIVRVQAKSFKKGLTVNYKSRVTKNTILNENVNFNGMRIKGWGKVDIGNNFHSGEDCLMITDVHNFNNGVSIPYDSTYIIKNITIEDNVWLGDRVILLGGIIIGEGSIIQAGSVVVNNIPRYSIAGGHPAAVFSQRDIEHYKKLKEEGKFH